jgi:hypothetical protein
MKNNKNNFDVIALSSYTAPSTVEHVDKDFVMYGEDNDYFAELIEHFMSSTTNGSIITGISNLVYGKGLGARDANLKPDVWAKLHAILRPAELKKAILDRKMLGMAALQVTYEGGKIKAITHFPMNTLRAEKADTNGVIKQWYYHRDWSDVKPNDKPKAIKAFGHGNKKGNEIYIIKPYVTGSFYYTPPDYVFALPYAKLEAEIGDYLINDTINGFSGSMMVNFNDGVPNQEVQRKMKQKVVANLTGATGQKVLINFNKNGENATTLERLTLDNAPDHYQYLADECRNKLIVGHRITSPLLIGVREAGSGFGSNADEIKTASSLMDNVLIKGFQDEFVDALNDILAAGDMALDLFFKTSQPLDFADESVEERVEEKSVEQLSSEEDAFDDERIEDLSGEAMNEDEWELVDTRDVSDDNSSDDDWASENIEANKNVLQKLSSIVSKKDKFSQLDKQYFKVRYAYTEKHASSGSRKFCKEMMSRSNKGIVYRLEDIDEASSKGVNKQFGHKGQGYDLFKFKGGPQCGHTWEQRLYRLKSKTAKRITKGTEVDTMPKRYQRKPRGTAQSVVAPKDMANAGRHPNNPNNN